MTSVATIQSDALGERLRGRIAAASDPLRNVPADTLPSLQELHDLQAWCDTIFVEADVGDLATILFCLSHILEEAFENLTGDFRYDDKADGMRRRFFLSLGEDLHELSISNFREPGVWQTVTTRILSNYAEVLSQLNRHQLRQPTRYRTDNAPT